MIDQGILIGTALALGCGVGLGWMLKGVSRGKHSDKAETIKEVTHNIKYCKR